MNSHAVRFFLTVAKYSSFRKAGESLHVAASAVNRQITLLEEELGAPLFERSRGRTRLRLTAAGEIFLAHARAATQELERARDQIGALQGLQAGSVTIGIPETLTRDFLPEFLERFHEDMPRIRLHILVENSPRIIEMLLADQVEVAIAFNPRTGGGVHVAAKLEKPTYLMMRNDHPLARRKTVRLSDYAQYPVILPVENSSMWAFHQHLLTKLPTRPPVALVTSSYEMMRSAARVGIGLAIVNDYLTPSADRMREGTAFVALVDPHVKAQVLACCVRSGRQLPVAVNVFVERFKQALQALK